MGVIKSYIDDIMSTCSDVITLNQRLGVDGGVSIPLIGGIIVNIRSGVVLLEEVDSRQDKKALQILLETGLVLKVELCDLNTVEATIVVYVNLSGDIALFMDGSLGECASILLDGLENSSQYSIKDIPIFVNKYYYIGKLTI